MSPADFRWKVDAHNECVDLVLNGYEKVFEVNQNAWLFIKLRHHSNGNVITIDSKPACLTIRKCKVIVKTIDYVEKGSFGSFSSGQSI